MKHCQEIMTNNPECCLASDKVYTIAQRMQSEDIGALPVVESQDMAKSQKPYVERPPCFSPCLRHGQTASQLQTS